jgi:hypothetical protein
MATCFLFILWYVICNMTHIHDLVAQPMTLSSCIIIFAACYMSMSMSLACFMLLWALFDVIFEKRLLDAQFINRTTGKPEPANIWFIIQVLSPPFHHIDFIIIVMFLSVCEFDVPS